MSDGAAAGRLAGNVLNFARLLRGAGLPVGTDRPLLALRALEFAGLESRADLYAVLRACFIDRIEHRPLFDEAFRVFWRDPRLLEELLRLMLPGAAPAAEAGPGPGPGRRLAEALGASRRQGALGRGAASRRVADGYLSGSECERLRKADFDSMTTAEWAAARRLVVALTPLLARLACRRTAPGGHGRELDMRQVLRDSGRRGGEFGELAYRQRATRAEPLTVIVDISGSMARYSRMFLHFVHALVNGHAAAVLRVHAFVFGTRLTNITRALRGRDPDEALARVVARVEDWSGGTRIGACLGEFNRRWAKRVPLGTSTVLLLTDGLERTDPRQLAREAAHLARSCRRLFWLNPLLRYDRFEPRAEGMRALLPHADRLLPAHNVSSLDELAQLLAAACREGSRWK
jgi:uncharacterized protein